MHTMEISHGEKMPVDMLIEDGLRACRNPTAAPAAEAYGPARAQVLSQAGFDAAEREIRQWPGYRATPLLDLPGLAQQLGVASVRYKDEGARFGLKSFKALGGAYAVYRLLEQAIRAHNGGEPVSAADVLAGRWRDVAQQITVTCATDGNHGRSVAWGAQMFGCRCVIYIHATVSEGRRAAIARYGAEVVRVPGNYDDSVRHADTQAQANGWTVVSDTTYEGYRDIPIDVMHGYGVMSREVIAELGDAPPTHVFVQAGVGAFAASVAAAFWLAWGERRPQLVVVEPIEADCHLRSAQAGGPVAVTGALDTVMAGLACGEVSPAAWEIVSGAASVFVALDDRYALDAVRRFAEPQSGDPVIVSGETGAVGLAALLAAHEHARLRALLGLDGNARVLLMGSEGDTDPDIYKQITGRTAAEVLA
jgi:diaminopropionate ammonia-lyase